MMHPMMKQLTLFGQGQARRKVAPTATAGKPGARVFGGYIASDERNRELVGLRRYQHGSDMLVNSSIVAASMRLYLDLIAQARFTFDGTDEAVEMAETALFEDPATPWHRIARRAGFFVYWGFSVQEWTMARREDGALTFHDIAPRAQRTIERWDVDQNTGAVRGFIQRNPNNYGEEIYIPRGKCMYMVDDALNDSPDGLGLYRNMIERYMKLIEYEKLEWSNFEDVALGTLIAMVPFSLLESYVQSSNQTLTDEGRRALEAPIKQFLQDRVEGRGKRNAIALDSAPYEGITVDNENRPTSLRQWLIERMKSETGGLSPFDVAINRLNTELSRVMGTEGMMLGGGSGSFALSKDKSHNFMLKVDGANKEIAETVKSDLLVPLWMVNGRDLSTVPEVNVEAVRFKDFEAIAKMLRDTAAAGAILDPQDPVVDAMRDLAGVPKSEGMMGSDDMDSSLMGGGKKDDIEDE